jgi:hypothetical protein
MNRFAGRSFLCIASRAVGLAKTVGSRAVSRATFHCAIRVDHRRSAGPAKSLRSPNGAREILAILLSGPNRPGPSRPDSNKKATPSNKGMAVSKGTHVVSSRTNSSEYSKNPSDNGSNDQEKRPPNSTNSRSYADDLEARREATRREEQAFVEASSDLDKLLADLDMSGNNVETAEEIIEQMSPDDLDADDERARVAEELSLTASTLIPDICH